MMLLLRILHVVLGALWVGPVVFMALFMEPTMRTIGPDAGKVMAELLRRGFSRWVFAAGLITVLAGLALFMVNSSANPDWVHTRAATAYSAGAALAIVGLVIGGSVVRPGVARMVSPGFAQSPEAPALRERLKVAGRIVAALLVLATLCMAVARYV